MYLGIEIGGTKLQLAVGAGDETGLVAVERREVDPGRGAVGILDQIEQVASGLLDGSRVRAIGVGFGGPVDPRDGSVVTSHQIKGWDGFPLRAWCRKTLGLPASVGNDCNVAALGEALFGAGRGAERLFYVTVGTGIGGGLVVGGRLQGADRPAMAEIGHLRPGLECEAPNATVESLASGPAIASAARESIRAARRQQDDRRPAPLDEDVADLLARAAGDVEKLTARHVGEAAADGNRIATQALGRATRGLGWAVAQVVTLLAPNRVVIGGGVAQIEDSLFLEPLRRAAARYVFRPLAGSYEIVPSGLGETVVVQGALALAAHCEIESNRSRTAIEKKQQEPRMNTNRHE